MFEIVLIVGGFVWEPTRWEEEERQIKRRILQVFIIVPGQNKNQTVFELIIGMRLISLTHDCIASEFILNVE